MGLIERIKTWALNNLPLIFAILRNTIPILRTKKITIVSRFTDVQEVLERPNVFGVTYAEKMKIITAGSNFFLGMDDTPTYTRDVSNMRLVVRRTDTQDIIAPAIEVFCASILSSSNGTMDVVQDYSRIIPAQFTDLYMGVAGPTPDELIIWTTAMFQYLFFPENPAGFDEKAIEYSKYTRDYLDKLISERKKSKDTIDDVLGRCLELQKSNTPGMDDRHIRDNLLGILIGAIPTTSKCVALVIDYLLDNPEELSIAQEAARNDDTEIIRKVVLESLRFNSFGAGIFRTTLEPYTIAKGTMRSKFIAKGSSVIVLTQSAMLDGRKVDSPSEFRLDRPDYNYMHFGYGMHTCFGEHINMVQIPIMVKSLLKCANLRRVSGEEGEMVLDGPFPSRLMVQFDSEADVQDIRSGSVGGESLSQVSEV